jgi:hypothetical protein
VQAGRIMAAASMNRAADMLYITELLGKNQSPTPAELHEGMDRYAFYKPMGYR